MRIVGNGAWGEPAHIDAAHRVVRRAVELGVDFIDTAGSYGPEVSERILADLLWPYPEGLRIGTKAGQCRPGPGAWVPLGRPGIPAPTGGTEPAPTQGGGPGSVPTAPDRPAPGDGRAVRRHGRDAVQGHTGLGPSEMSVAVIRAAQWHFTVATVQYRYNISERASGYVVAYCTENAPAPGGEHRRCGLAPGRRCSGRTALEDHSQDISRDLGSSSMSLSFVLGSRTFAVPLKFSSV